VTVPDSPQRPTSAPRIWDGVPPRNKNFTGRSDIFEQLRQRMPSKVTAVVPLEDSLPQALQGLGGVGKTAVAIEYAWRYRMDYDLVCWIRADQMPLVRSSLARLATALGLEPSATGIDLTTKGVLDALRRGEPYRRWLLIFDNADQPEELLPFIPSGPGDVLITSRNNRWHSVVDTVPLDVFERAESNQFLLKRVPKGLSAADANRLADKLGDLPLALVQAGAVLFEGGMPVDEYLRLLEERVTQILERGTSPEYPTSMTAAWQISVGRLRQQSPQALELLRCCAFLGPEPIPRDVFNLGAHESRTGVGELTADPIELSTAVGMLGRFALVKIDGPHISVHRLIQALLRDELTSDEQYKYRQDAHTMLSVGTPGDPTNVRTWPRYNDLVAHVASSATDLGHCQMPAHRALAMDIVRYLYVSGDFPSCRLIAEQFLPQWIEDSGTDDPHVLDMKRHLGNALRELGLASEAYQLIAATLDSAERVLGLKNPLTLALRNAFGADLRARGEFTAARELDAETLRLHDDIFGSADPQTLRVMNNLALDHGLSSDFVAARDLHKKVLILLRDPKRSVSATEVLNSSTALARAARLCGNLHQARDLGIDARNYGLHELGPEHHLTVRAAIDLSIAMRGIPDDYDEALEIAGEVLELCTRRRGERNPDTLAAAVSVSNIRRKIGQIDQALELATATAGIYPAVYGADHPYTYGCTGNVALLYRLAGDAAEARRLNEAALAGLDARLTRDHLFTLTVAANLASDLAAIGCYSQARAIGEDSLARLSRLLGEDHPFALGFASNLVLDLQATGAHEDAEALSAKVASGFQRTTRAEYELAAAGSRIAFDFDPPPI
jgi:Tetratricopeptide repeat